MGYYLATHAIGLGIILLLLVMCIGVLAMHIVNKESGRAWIIIAKDAQANSEKLQESLTQALDAQKQMREVLISHFKNQAGLIEAVHEIARNTRPAGPLMPTRGRNER